jgi:hypothetical protein
VGRWRLRWFECGGNSRRRQVTYYPRLARRRRRRRRRRRNNKGEGGKAEKQVADSPGQTHEAFFFPFPSLTDAFALTHSRALLFLSWHSRAPADQQYHVGWNRSRSTRRGAQGMAQESSPRQSPTNPLPFLFFHFSRFAGVTSLQFL